MATADTTRPAPVATAPPLPRARRILLAAPVILGGLTIAVVLALVPWGERNELGYEALAPVRDAAWTGIFVDALAMAALGFGLGLVVCSLAAARGAAWANAGAVLTALGGVLFGQGAVAYAALAWYATDPAVLDPEQGSALLDYAQANPEHAMVLQMAGFLLFSLGTLLLSVALLRAGTVTRWLPIAVIALTVLLFAIPGRTQDFTQIAQMLVFIGIGVAYLRSGR